MCKSSWTTPMSYTVQIRSASELKWKLNYNCKLGTCAHQTRTLLFIMLACKIYQFNLTSCIFSGEKSSRKAWFCTTLYLCQVWMEFGWTNGQISWCEQCKIPQHISIHYPHGFVASQGQKQCSAIWSMLADRGVFVCSGTWLPIWTAWEGSGSHSLVLMS